MVSENNFFEELSKFFKKKCELLYEQLYPIFGKNNVFKPNGGYFIIVRIPDNIEFEYDENKGIIKF